MDRAIAAIFLLQVIVILSFMGLCQRYIAELFPFLIFAFLIFLRQGKIAFQLRYLLYRTGCRLGGDQLIVDRFVARGSRHERAGGNPGEMESVSGQNVTKLTGERERWTSRSGLSMLAFRK